MDAEASRWWTLPLQPHPLTCPSSEETEKEPAVNTSCFPTDRQGRRHSHILLSLSSPPSPSSPSLSARYAFHLSNPHFFPSQSPSLVGRSFQPPLQQKKQRRQGHFPSFPPCREKKKWRTRPADHPFQRRKDRAQQKVSARNTLTPTHANYMQIAC